MAKPLHVLLIGETGGGKSTLGNILLGDQEYEGLDAPEGHPCNVEGEHKTFKSGHGAEACTLELESLSSTVRFPDEGILRVLREQQDEGVSSEHDIQRNWDLMQERGTLYDLTVTDSAGVPDTRGRGTAFTDAMIREIKRRPPNGIIYIINGKNPRLSDRFRLSLQILKYCLGSALTPSNLLIVCNQVDLQTGMCKIREGTEKRKAKQEAAKTLIRQARQFLLDGSSIGSSELIMNNDNERRVCIALRERIKSFPETVMSTETLRTWSEVVQKSQEEFNSADAAERENHRLVNILTSKIEELENSTSFYRRVKDVVPGVVVAVGSLAAVGAAVCTGGATMVAGASAASALGSREVGRLGQISTSEQILEKRAEKVLAERELVTKKRKREEAEESNKAIQHMHESLRANLEEHVESGPPCTRIRIQ